MQEELTSNFDDLLRTGVIGVRVVNEDRYVNYRESVMGNHLQLRPLEQIHSDYCVQASAPEERDGVQVCFLVFRGHILANIYRADLLLRTWNCESVSVSRECSTKHEWCEVKHN